MPTENPRGLSLGARLFLAIALLTALAVGTAVVVTSLLGHRVADRAVRQALARAGSAGEVFSGQRQNQLGLIARNLSDNPDFAAYFAESLSSGDALSILDQLDERRADLGFDFAMALDADGKLFARTDDPSGVSQDLSGEPLIAAALEEFEASGLWTQDGKIYDVAVTPVATGGYLDGFLVAGFEINDLTALELRRVQGTEVAFFSREVDAPRLAAGTLDPPQAEALQRLLSGSPELLSTPFVESTEGAPNVTASQLTLDLDGRRWLAQVTPLANAGEEPLGVSVALASLDERLAPFRRLGRLLLGVGALTILLGSIVSFWLARRIVGPLRRLVDVSQAAAEGDYDQRIEDDGGDEVGRLGRAFDTLLSELREKRDMEVYVNQLVRSLPEPQEADPVATQRPRPTSTEPLTVLGIELRRPDGGAAPPPTFELLEQGMRQLSDAIAGRDGIVEAIAGHRLLASFSGKLKSRHAVDAASEILTLPQGELGGARAAVAAVAGQTVRGTLGWSLAGRPGLTGTPVEQLEALLREIKAGGLVLDRTVYSEVNELLDHAGLNLKEQTSPISRLSVYTLSAAAASRIFANDSSATLAAGGAQTHRGGGQTMQTSQQVSPGSYVDGRFEILSTLGRGGMGVVYKARDHELDELVALKMLKSEALVDDAQLESLKSEIKLARKISHVNVLRTFDFGEVNGLPFISMEYVRGITLRRLLEESGPLPMSAGLRLSRQLCRGLAAAHEQGVLHRDIKPENLILEPNGNAKLMDFGIAQPFRPGTHREGRTDKLVGTPFYFAPEQIQGQLPDARADIYACGVVLYEIFTGQLPFPSDGNLMQILMRKTDQPPTPPSQHWAAIPRPLEHIILCCLERDREQRYDRVVALLDELEVLRG